MSKITLQTISSFQNDVSASNAFNANMQTIQEAIDLLLSRDGESPNVMTSVLDMNSQRIINLPSAISPTEPVTQAQLDALVLSATSGSIVNGSIVEPHFSNGAVSTRVLADSSVTTVKINNNAVTADKIASSAVTTAKLLDNNVTLAKLIQLANGVVLGNVSGSTANAQTITIADLATALSAYGSGDYVKTGSIHSFATSRLPSGYLLCNGSTVSRTSYSTLYNWLCPTQTITFTVASSLVNWTGHPLTDWDRVVFSTTGTLPTGITAGTTYYVRDSTANTFKLATVIGGSAVAMSGTPTGTNSVQALGYGLGDGSTTFTLPDLRGEFLRGHDFARGVDATRMLGSFQDHQIQNHIHNYYQSNARSFTYGAGGGVGYNGDSSLTTTGDPSSGNHGTETRPRNISVCYAIKT